MYHLRKDTIAGAKLSALFMKRSMGAQPLPEVMKQVNKYMSENSGHASPEGEAFKFYYANHVFSAVSARFDQNEILPDDFAWLVRNYVKLSSDLVVRLAYYCLLIITREARHLHKSESTYAKVEEKFGARSVAFLKAICGKGEEGAVGMLRQSPPDIPLGKYVEMIEYVFFKGGWGGGYGGPAWGKVAQTLRQMVTGEITPEMFADIAFTLAHNNGPIFNKGMLYSGYSHFIYKLLDVQRSGQIPQLYEDSEVKFSVADMVDFIDRARKSLPDVVLGFVDWFRVEALGAMHSYAKEKQKQMIQHGQSEFEKEMEKKNGKKFYVGKNQFVMVVEREQEAA